MAPTAAKVLGMSSMSQITKTQVPSWVMVGGLTLLGALLRWWNIGKASIWHDEGFSVMLAHLSPAEIVARTARDVHPPLYYLVLHYWMILFGNSEAAVRSLSLVSTVAIIPLCYLLVRRLWNERGAQLAAVFVCLGPILVRYSQEARMYGLQAFLVLLTVYCLVRALESSGWKWWTGYALSLAASLYTYYYTIFIIPTLLALVTFYSSRQKGSGWWSKRWWLSNLGVVLLFTPWVPSALAQFSRNKNFGWIAQTTPSTLPNTLLQFIAGGHPPAITAVVSLSIGVLFTGLLGLAWIKGGRRRHSLVVFGLYGLAGPVMVYCLGALGAPYLDRYFVYASVGLFCLLGLMVSMLGRRLQLITLAAVLAVMGAGNYVLHSYYPHKVRSLGAYVNQHYHHGDYILADMMLSYFDFSFYNHTGSPTHVWQEHGVNGYGESSLIYTNQRQLVVRRLEDVQPASGKLWLLIKLDKRPTKGRIPSNWKPLGFPLIFGGNAVQEYLVESRSQK